MPTSLDAQKNSFLYTDSSPYNLWKFPEWNFHPSPRKESFPLVREYRKVGAFSNAGLSVFHQALSNIVFVRGMLEAAGGNIFFT